MACMFCHLSTWLFPELAQAWWPQQDSVIILISASSVILKDRHSLQGGTRRVTYTNLPNILCPQSLPSWQKVSTHSWWWPNTVFIIIWESRLIYQGSRQVRIRQGKALVHFSIIYRRLLLSTSHYSVYDHHEISLLMRGNHKSNSSFHWLSDWLDIFPGRKRCSAHVGKCFVSV